MSRNLAAPSACPVDLFAALARRGSDGERERLLDHVENCEKCLGLIATSKGVPKARSSVPEADDDDPIEIGDVIAEKYRVDGLIGSGAMGSVYRAHHLALRSDVAIKVLRPERRHEVNAERRFSREARAMWSLRSPHAIRTFDIDRLPSGVPYIVMEYLAGADLSATVREQGPLPMADAIRYIMDACDAVGEAHGLAIIHRDLKPANLFVTSAGVLKVLDFGLAKNLPQVTPDAGSEATQTNFLLGSPHYMSPEQLRSAKDVDARADIWSLGSTLFQLVCGTPPFTGDNLFVLISHILNDDPPVVSSIAPHAPPGLDEVVAKCLRRDRNERYGSCAELKRALAEVHEGMRSSDGTVSLAWLEERESAALAEEAEAKGNEMYSSTMDAMRAKSVAPGPSTVKTPATDKGPTTDPLAGLESVSDQDDVDPTVAVDAGYLEFGSAPNLPRVYDEEPEQPGTMVMSQTVERLLASAANPVAVPRVYDDDVELLADITKLMLDSPFRPHTSETVPMKLVNPAPPTAASSANAFPPPWKTTMPMPALPKPAPLPAGVKVPAAVVTRTTSTDEKFRRVVLAAVAILALLGAYLIARYVG